MGTWSNEEGPSTSSRWPASRLSASEHVTYNLTTERGSTEEITNHAIQHPEGPWDTQETEPCRDHALATAADGTLDWACNDDEGIVHETRPQDGERSREIALDGSELAPLGRRRHRLRHDIDLDEEGRPHVGYAKLLHTWTFSCAEAFNDYDQLRYDEPFAATAALATDAATGTIPSPGDRLPSS